MPRFYAQARQRATVHTAGQPIGALQVSVTALDADVVAKPAAQVQVWVDVDDFTRLRASGDRGRHHHASSRPRDARATAGEAYALPERISPLP